MNFLKKKMALVLLLMFTFLAGSCSKNSIEIGPAEPAASVTYSYMSLPKYNESGQAGMISETFLMETPKKTAEELSKLPSNIASWRITEKKKIFFGEDMRHPLLVSVQMAQDKMDKTKDAQINEEENKAKKTSADKETECPVVYQYLAYRFDSSGNSPVRVLAYGGCPFLVMSLEVEKQIKLATPVELEIVGEEGNVLRLAQESTLPFLADNIDLVYLCSNVIGVTWRFQVAGIRLDFVDASFIVTKAGATIAFTDKGVLMKGVRKLNDS